MSNTARLYISIKSLTNFKFTAKGIYSTTTGSDHGTVTIRLLDASSTVRYSSTYSLSATPSDFAVTYNDFSNPITRADLECSFTPYEEVIFYCNNGTEVIDYGNVWWLGWVKPENITRPFITK